MVDAGCEIRIGTSGWHYDHWIGRFFALADLLKDRLAAFTRLILPKTDESAVWDATGFSPTRHLWEKPVYGTYIAPGIWPRCTLVQSQGTDHHLPSALPTQNYVFCMEDARLSLF